MHQQAHGQRPGRARRAVHVGGEAGITLSGPEWPVAHHAHLPEWDKASPSCPPGGQVLSIFQSWHPCLRADRILHGVITIISHAGQLFVVNQTLRGP